MSKPRQLYWTVFNPANSPLTASIAPTREESKRFAVLCWGRMEWKTLAKDGYTCRKIRIEIV